MNNDRSLMPRLLSSALLIALAFATVAWSRQHWFLCLFVCSAVVALGLREMMGLLKAKGIHVFDLYTIAGGVAIIAAIFFWKNWFFGEFFGNFLRNFTNLGTYFFRVWEMWDELFHFPFKRSS